MTQSGTPARAVFVDPTGRRSRLVARICWGLGALLVAYVALVVASLVLPPSLSRLSVPGLGRVLPGPGAAVLGAEQGVDEASAPDVLLERTPSPLATATGTTARPTPRATLAPPPPAAPGRPPAAPTRSAAPTREPAVAPTRDPGRPSTAPTRRSTSAPTSPPGPRASRTPKPRPTRGPR